MLRPQAWSKIDGEEFSAVEDEAIERAAESMHGTDRTQAGILSIFDNLARTVPLSLPRRALRTVTSTS